MYREKYNHLKSKLKSILYENEVFKEELRRLQKELLDLYRDKDVLLERVIQYEEFSSSDSDSDDRSSDSDSEQQREHQGVIIPDQGLNVINSNVDPVIQPQIGQMSLQVTQPQQVILQRPPVQQQFQATKQKQIVQPLQQPAVTQQQPPQPDIVTNIKQQPPQSPVIQQTKQQQPAKSQKQQKLQQQPPNASAKPVKTLKCHVCNKSYKTPHGLRTHVAAQHPDSPAVAAKQIALQPETGEQIVIAPAPQLQQPSQIQQTYEQQAIMIPDQSLNVIHAINHVHQPQLDHLQIQVAPTQQIMQQQSQPHIQTLTLPHSQAQIMQTQINTHQIQYQSNNQIQHQPQLSAHQLQSHHQPQPQPQPSLKLPQQQQNQNPAPTENPSLDLNHYQYQYQAHNHSQDSVQYQNQGPDQYQFANQNQTQDQLSAEELEKYLERRRMEQAELLLPQWEPSVPDELEETEAAIKFMAED